MPSLTTNNSFATATTLNGVTSAPRSLIDNQLIRLSDAALNNPTDIYKFNLSGVSNLKVNLTEVSGDVKLSIYQSLTGAIPTDTDTPLNIRSSNTKRISDSYTSTADPVLAELPAGTYYIKVELASPTTPSGNYNLLVTGSSRQITNSMLWRDPSGSLKSWQLDGSTIVASSTFNTTAPTPVPSTLQIVSTGDIDGDGVSDILWRDTATSTMRVWLMANGTQVKDGGNLTISDGTGQAISRGSQWTVSAVGDFDGDSAIDIMWRNTVSGEVSLWFLNYSNGTASIPPSMTVGKDVTLTTGLSADWVVAGTANADGKFGQDILWRNTATNEISIFNLNRNGIEELGYRILGRLVSQDWKIIAYKDFNSDGIADIVWRNEQTEGFAVWNMASDPLLPKFSLYGGISANFKIIGTEDMGGDGRPDILWWNPVSGELSVFNIADDGLTVVSNLGGYYLQTEIPGQASIKTLLKSSNGQWTPEAVQDFNGDGKADILWRDKGTGTLYYWKMDDLILRDYSLIKDAPTPNQTTPPPATTLPGNFIATGLSYGAYRTTNVIQVQSLNVRQVTAGTSRTSAFNIGVLEGDGSFNDFVGGAGPIDRSDWYTFTVETPSFLTALVSTSSTASSPALKAEVYSADSNIPINNVTGIDSVLPRGTYYIRVSHSSPLTSGIETPYTLTFTGKVGITNLNTKVAGTDGFGLVLNKNSIALDTVSANNPIDVTSFKFINDGDFAANDVQVGFYLSKNGTFEAANDKLITLTSTTTTTTPGQTIANNLLIRSSVGRGTTVTLSGLRLSLPSKNDPFWDASANYSIIAVIDPNGTLVSEKKKDDNTQAATLATIGVGNADLLGTGFTVNGSNSTIKPGATISGAFSINNKGSRSTGVNGGSVSVKFYISSDAAIGDVDYLASEVIIPSTNAIAPGATRPGTYSFTLPTLSAADPTKWDVAWGRLKANKTTPFTAYVGMIIEFVDDADTSNNSNLGIGKDEGEATVVPT